MQPFYVVISRPWLLLLFRRILQLCFGRDSSIPLRFPYKKQTNYKVFITNLSAGGSVSFEKT